MMHGGNLKLHQTSVSLTVPYESNFNLKFLPFTTKVLEKNFNTSIYIYIYIYLFIYFILIYNLENDKRYQLDATVVIYYHKYLYMFWTSVCPSSGVYKVVYYCILCSAL